MLVCKILDNDLTEYQVCYNLNFKKPLDSFSPQIERKRSKKYLVIILAGNNQKKTINTAFASQHVPPKNRVSDF